LEHGRSARARVLNAPRAILSRRDFVGSLAAIGAVAPGLTRDPAFASEVPLIDPGAVSMTDPITNEKIRRARLSGPSQVTANATVAEMDAQGRHTILLKGTNE
jgi:hypothetical protein